MLLLAAALTIQALGTGVLAIARRETFELLLAQIVIGLGSGALSSAV